MDRASPLPASALQEQEGAVPARREGGRLRGEENHLKGGVN